MTIRRLAPEQARQLGAAAGAALERLREQLRPVVEAVRAFARHVLEALRRMRRVVEQGRAAGTLPGRPAWQSPYGPPQRRR